MKNIEYPRRFLKIFSSSFALAALTSLSLSSSLKAHTTSTSTPLDITLCTISNPCNPPDDNGLGAVADIYQIAQTDVTASQYCAFLNAVATHGDPNGLYDERMGADTKGAPALISCNQSGKNTVTYHVIGDRGNYPIIYVSYFSAQRFCNWIQNGQPVRPEGPATTESGAYAMSGDTIVPLTPGAVWHLPTEDQYYKAAYYKSGDANGYWKYTTRSDTPPTPDVNGNNSANYGGWSVFGNNWHLMPVSSYYNTPGEYGTFDMGGNVNQWIESPADASSKQVMIRGGDWEYGSGALGYYPANKLASDSYDTKYPSYACDTIGFRIVGPATGSTLDNVAGLATTDDTATTATDDTATTATDDTATTATDDTAIAANDDETDATLSLVHSTAASMSSYIPDIRDRVSFNNLTPDEQIGLATAGAVGAIAGGVYYVGVDVCSGGLTAAGTAIKDGFNATLDSATAACSRGWANTKANASAGWNKLTGGFSRGAAAAEVESTGEEESTVLVKTETDRIGTEKAAPKRNGWFNA